MIEKRNIFTAVVSDEEYEEYKNRGFITEDGFVVEKLIYKVLFVFFVLFFSFYLYLFYKLRKSYIISQRGFTLSFIGGIITFITVILGFLPQVMKVPCSVTLYSANVLNVASYVIFFTRSLRIVLFYYFNIYKVTSYRKRKIIFNKIKDYREHEPNNYLQRLYKKINLIIIVVIAIPISIALIVTIAVSIKERENCPFFKGEDALLSLKDNKLEDAFIIVRTFGRIYMIVSLIMTIILCFVKDANTFGVKFECLSVSAMIFIFSLINMILQINVSDDSTNNHRKFFLDIFEITKGGKILFTIVSIYILFTSITLPVIKYYSAKKNKSKNANDIKSSREYFYKVLNTPSLVYQLRDIAIKEFSVENVLFWENYNVLKSLVTRYFVEYKKAEEMGNVELIEQYDFDGYYHQQIQSYSSYSRSSLDGYSYDSKVYVPKKIIPYYDRFYNTFISENAIAQVNISGKTYKNICNDILLPTTGIFDAAKDEVIEMIYNSIYPIFLKNNKKYLDETI